MGHWVSHSPHADVVVSEKDSSSLRSHAATLYTRFSCYPRDLKVISSHYLWLLQVTTRREHARARA